jgi:hypothetical protein
MILILSLILLLIILICFLNLNSINSIIYNNAVGGKKKKRQKKKKMKKKMKMKKKRKKGTISTIIVPKDLSENSSKTREQNLDILIKKQNYAISHYNLNNIDKNTWVKYGHWAWWIWPHGREGVSEDDPKTSVTSVDEAAYLINSGDFNNWMKSLEDIIDAVQIQKNNHTRPIDSIDHNRIKCFLQDWHNKYFTIEMRGKIPENKFNRFKEVFKKIKDIWTNNNIVTCTCSDPKYGSEHKFIFQENSIFI